ncbi:uncharacterized protein DSM5745_09854 [Aspergillus mulundensis]|uniref:Nephrocystin 3-like N-terminal domain-containing protein n=1 Tax=Aspergillus mulundensis TaxID=1810919 RepID=A0A3D8QRJ5_9EURO|nr:hypothetical protein DSM5745_09854 [Aspergillus mulundensis]RDW64443.1 hypothetical protein DSM5745_09854 [Aspergillus mulundensis]
MMAWPNGLLGARKTGRDPHGARFTTGLTGAMAESAEMTHPRHARAFEIAFLCVLKVERDAIELALDERYERDGLVYPQAPSDTNAYTTGRIGSHNVVIAYLPGVGNVSSAAAAASIPSTFPSVKLAIVVGVCGVNPHARNHAGQEVLLGDVIVSTTMLRASYGHQYPDGFVLGRTEDTIRLAPVAIRTFLHKLEGISSIQRLEEKTAAYTEEILKRGLLPGATYPGPEQDTLNRLATGLHPDGTRIQDTNAVTHARQPSVLFGKFASGESVMKSGYHRDKLADEHDVIGFEMEGAGTWDYLPTIIVKGACDYADSHKNKVWQQYSAVTAAACAKSIVEEGRLSSAQQQPEISKEISEIPRVMDACFDSQKLQDTRTCLDDTRVALMEEIQHWATSANAQPVFWLQGVAGSGKTIIAKTVAKNLSRKGHLGATFFFSRQGGDRGSATKLFGTLAYQLAVKPGLSGHDKGHFRSLLHDAIVSHRDVFGKAYREQWEQLIMNPILQLDNPTVHERRQPVVIVIDAVDECEPVYDVGLILELLIQANRLQTIPLRFFVTGRPQEAVHYGFRRIRENLEQIVLHQIDSDLVDADIRRFVTHEFDDIGERHFRSAWYTKEQLDEVVSRSEGLFIYAATLSRSLGRSLDPGRRLSQFLQIDSSRFAPLRQMYDIILDASAPEASNYDFDDTEREIFKLIVGSLAVLFDTLSINTLHQLLAGSSFLVDFPPGPESIETTLVKLASVLDIPYVGHLPDRDRPIRIFHPSFREFLLEERPPSLQHLQLDSSSLHENMLHGCLAAMTGCLRKNVCRLATPDADPQTLSKDFVALHIPPEVQYACKYWIFHAEQLLPQAMDRAVSDSGPVHQFLTNTAIYWLEAMSLLRMVPHAVTSLVALRALVESNKSPTINSLIQDTSRFLMANRVIISEAPLQIYCSALLFSPSSSVIKKLFTRDIPSWFLKRPDVPVRWPSSITLGSFMQSATCLDFSPDGKTLVSGYDDGSIRFWDIRTGFLQQTISERPWYVVSVQYSHDGKRVLTGANGAVCLYDVMTGTLLREPGEPDSVAGGRAAFSHDGQLIITGNEQAAIWDNDLLSLRCVLNGHMDSVSCLAFTPNNRSVITGSWDSKIRIYDSTQGMLQHVLDMHTTGVVSMFVCPALNRVATADRKAIHIWDPVTHVLSSTVEFTETGSGEIALSSDGTLLAGQFDSSNIRIWDTNTWSPCHMLKDHTNSIYLLKFSADSRFLGSASADGTVRLWDLDGNTFQEQFATHRGCVAAIKFSPNGQIIATTSDDAVVKIYDIATGNTAQVHQSVDTHIYGLGFSPAGSLLAVAALNSSIYILNTQDWSYQHALENDEHLLAVAFSPDGKLLAGGYRSNVKIWDTADWVLVHTLPVGLSSTYPVVDNWAVEFSPDGRLLACASNGSLLFIFNLQKDAAPTILRPEFPFTKAISFSPDSLRVVCRSHVGKTKSWKFYREPAHDEGTWIPAPIEDNWLVTPRMFEGSSESRWAIQGPWVIFLGNKILYLPDDRRVHTCDIFGNTIAIGSESGIVTVLQFRDLDEFVVDSFEE